MALLDSIVIDNLRGGLNNSDPPLSLPFDQVVGATNVEFTKAGVCERRKGSIVTNTVLNDSGAVAARVVFMNTHQGEDTTGVPIILVNTNTRAAVPHFYLFTGSGYSGLTERSAAVYSGTIDDSDATQYVVQGQTFHGKTFLAYKTSGDRLKVYDGTAVRQVGLATPAAPTGADSGTPGTAVTGIRYYRVRYTFQSGGATLRRSEPSPVLTFTPSGTNTTIVVTKPASISEEETHWELEASVDNANFYVLATTVVGTTTVSDTTVYATGYSAGVLSATIGDYTVPWSARYLAADEDRLLFASSYTTTALLSRVGWTPVGKDPGVGNDERIPIATDNYLDLDASDGGIITGLSSAVGGVIYVFKERRVYKLVRTGIRTNAYEAFPVSKEIGAVHGSIVAGLDEQGHPAVYFTDPKIGPCMIRVGEGTVIRCGADIRTTWATVQLYGLVPVRAVYFAAKRQVHWWVATGTDTRPTIRIVLQVNEMRETAEGMRRGWSIWTGPSCSGINAVYNWNYALALASSTLADVRAVPYIAKESPGGLWVTDNGYKDNGTAYSATLTTRPFLFGKGMNKFGVTRALVTSEYTTDHTYFCISLNRDFGTEFSTETTIDTQYTPIYSELVAPRVQKVSVQDDIRMSEARFLQVYIVDSASSNLVVGRWEINSIILEIRGEQRQ